MDQTAPPRQFTLGSQVSLFTLSAATLVFEINLSRLFSVTQFYHFAFMIVSLALLGYGASGTYLAIFPNTGRKNPDRVLSALSLGAALSILGAYLLTNALPFDSFSIAWDRRQVLILALHYAALALPFFFGGMAVGLLLGALPRSAGNVYAVNLTGSALGCLGALVSPLAFGGEGTVVLSSGLAAAAGLIPLFTGGQRNKYKVIVSLLSGLVLVFTSITLGLQLRQGEILPLFRLNISPYKSLSYALQFPGAEIISQEWNAFSRVDIVRSDGVRSLPGVSFRYPQAPPPELGLFVDADDLNPVVLPGADLDFTPHLLSALAYELKPQASTLLLGPRGGLDILTAISQDASQVTAVEPNPLIVEAAYHIYVQEQVDTVIETGRSYLRRTRDQFDIVQYSLSSTYHPVRSGAYSLAEDYTYTLQSFDDALDRLDDHGILVVMRWLQVPPSEWLRAFTLAVTALEDNGIDPSENIVAIRSYNLGMLLIKKTPFSSGELQIVRTFAAERAFDLVYLPGLMEKETNQYSVLEEPVYYQAFTGFLQAPSRQTWLDEYPYEVSPPTDNHPLFGHYFKWSQTPQIIAELGRTWQPFGGAGYFVLLVLLALTLVMAVVIIILPLLLTRGTPPPRGTTAATLTYFGLIGLAFLLVEIPLIQRYILYLGHPSYALTTALFAILLFSGIGSYNAHRFSHRAALVVLVVVALATPWLLSLLFSWTLGLPLVFRLFIAVLSLAPLGFLMGMPFPGGISKLESAAPRLIPWAWGVNGALSVISSILAALFALSFGFSWTLIAGAVCYAGAWLVSPRLKV